jgi:predicted ATPase
LNGKKYEHISVEYADGSKREIPPIKGSSSGLNLARAVSSFKAYYIKYLRVSNTSTVQNLAKEMAALLLEKKQNEQKLSEKLSATQHNRIRECSPLDENDYKERFTVLLEKYHQLEALGIYSDPLQYADYTENRQYLTIFLEDFEQRVNIYSEIIIKSSLFCKMLETKELNNKKITVNKDKGFLVLTDAGQELNLFNLSSGEQQEIIFHYELLFKVKEDSIVLIDEPETSMHVEWQRQFIPDLKKIKQINNNLSFLIATHSPQIIGNDWDLTVDLFDLSKGKNKNA